MTIANADDLNDGCTGGSTRLAGTCAGDASASHENGVAWMLGSHDNPHDEFGAPHRGTVDAAGLQRLLVKTL